MSYKYSQKLYKQFVIIDLSQYTTGKIGMRWRTEKEVISGKGESICAAKGCSANQNIEEYQVNFAYKEMGEKKNTEVRVRVCTNCAQKMNYKKQYKKVVGKSIDEQIFN